MRSLIFKMGVVYETTKIFMYVHLCFVHNFSSSDGAFLWPEETHVLASNVFLAFEVDYKIFNRKMK